MGSQKRPFWRDYGSKAERVLSMDFGAYGIRFFAQHGFDLKKEGGGYRRVYVDFYLPDSGTVIEVDGPGHGKTTELDSWRDRSLIEQGKCKKVVRVKNVEVYRKMALTSGGIRNATISWLN